MPYICSPKRKSISQLVKWIIFAYLTDVTNWSAGVVKLVDIPDLGSGAARHGGSSPSTRTDKSSRSLKG